MMTIQEKLNLALQQHQEGNFQEAEALYREIIRNNPNNDSALYYLGFLAYQSGQYNFAVEYFYKAVEINPKAEYFKDLGNLFFDLNRKDEAVNFYEKAINIGTEDADIYFNLALLYQQTDNIEQSIRNFEHVLRLNPNDYEVYGTLGCLYLKAKNIDKAIFNYERAISINSQFDEGYLNLGIAFIQKRMYKEAVNCFKRIIQINPENIEAYYNLASIFSQEDSYNEAIECYKKVIELKPDFYEAYNNLGTIFTDIKQYEEAQICFEKVIELNPGFLTAYMNLGHLYKEKKEIEKSIEYYKKVIELNPDYYEAYVRLSMLFTYTGKFDLGLQYYEYRLLTDNTASILRGFSQPMWTGKESLDGKTIFVLCEGGLGDTIHYARFFPLLQSLGAKVLFRPQKGLEELFKSCDLKAEIINESDQNNEIIFDTYSSIMSLPYLLNININTIPFSEGYLKADTEKIRLYKEKYFNKDKFKIGINWQCNVNKYNQDRLIPHISYLYPLLKLKNTKFYSLQKGIGTEQLSMLPEDVEITNLGDIFNDFSDTASAIENLDLVITVDTAVALLAGALGKPVWILLPYVSDCKWFIDSYDTPWYKSAKLFRQNNPGDWNQVIGDVFTSLEMLNI